MVHFFKKNFHHCAASNIQQNVTIFTNGKQCLLLESRIIGHSSHVRYSLNGVSVSDGYSSHLEYLEEGV